MSNSEDTTSTLMSNRPLQLQDRLLASCDRVFNAITHVRNTIFETTTIANGSFQSDMPNTHDCDKTEVNSSYKEVDRRGDKIDRTVAKGKGPRTFILYGKNYHLMGSLIPQEGDHAKFAQLYVFDTHNEIENCISAISGKNTDKVHKDIVRDLKIMLDQHNVLVKAFRMAGQKINGDATSVVKLRLLGKQENDGRRYNLPSTNEVAALIVGDFDLEKIDRDIVVETRSGRLQRINQLNPSYLRLQYPLLFPYGEDGFKEHIPVNKRRTNSTKGREDVMMKDFFAFRIQERLADGSPLLSVVYPHAHILVFLHRDDKYPTADNIDRIISAEIPNKDRDPLYYEAVEKYMMHGPCGSIRKDSLCMKNGKCIRHFPKKFVNNTTIDEDGYPVYRRRDDGKTVSKCGVELDNRYVVPHNRKLLLRYGTHINVEWCNQSRSIKYLFKYINKGNDRVTATFYSSGTTDVENDECDEFGKYLGTESTLETLLWYIWGPGEQPIIFQDHENLEDVAKKASVKESMFLGWFQANKKYSEAQSLTYSEFPSKFVWKPLLRKWFPRKSHSVIRRIFFVPPGSGEIYYLRLLLNFVRGPTSFEDIRTIDGILYLTFREACYAQGILDDDKEYIDAIEEASIWGSGQYLRKLFATLLFSNTITRPKHVWENTWKLLSDDILHKQRRLLNNQGNY
ncbi:uncharacterized protein [Arachis hypogaea]|uniref:uncharacterized protein n=1 Tax=Arachis hypogaea TaxID=3818 RepID=UPI003B20BFC5